jgi:predicted Zn-dependent protease
MSDHAAMGLIDTLARVEADLATGRVPMARQRLRGLVTSFPQDLLLRRRLGELYRLFGEPAQAGRWMYLEADRDPSETSAFEERYATPLQRMRALAWRAPESLANTPFAAQQLAAVRKASSDYVGRPVDWTTCRGRLNLDPLWPDES